MSEQTYNWQGSVLPEWVDYNGHMNDAEYARVFSIALESMMAYIGLDEAGREQHQYTIFTLESHIKYLKEAHEDEPLSTTVLILDRDEKRLHLWVELMNKAGQTVATSEQMIMGMSQATSRPAPFPAAVATKVVQLPHAGNEWPSGANTVMGIRRK